MVNFNSKELNKEDHRVFHHITENTPQLCMSGHKVRHFTYLFNITEYTILKIGTSYCKKNGLLKNHIKNDLLITVLREFIKSTSFFDYNIDYINLSEPIFNYINSTIEKRIDYFQNMDLSTDEIEYYNYRLPLEHLKKDILEIKTEYFPIDKFHNFSDDYSNSIERIDDLLNYQNNKGIDHIEETLTNIQNEILEILGSESSEFERIIDLEYEIKIQDEFEMEKNIEIEESLRDEIKKLDEIKILEEYQTSEQNYIDLKSEEYYEEKEEKEEKEKEEKEKEEMEEIVKIILREITEDIEKSESEISLNRMNQIIDSHKIHSHRMHTQIQDQQNECIELDTRIRRLKNEITDFKIELAIFKNNLNNLKQNIEIQENKTHSLFIKYNIPWIKYNIPWIK